MRPLLLFLPLVLAAGCGVHGNETCPTTGPSPRAYATAVLVPTYNEVYLYGGQTGTTLAGSAITSDELWRYSFDGCSGWVKVVPAGTSPGGLSRYAAALDSKRNRIIYVGGPTNDSWSLDISKLTWTKLLTAGLPPSASQQPWAVYDSDADQIIVGSVFATPLDFSDSDDGNWQSPIMFDAALGSAAAIDPTRDQIFTWNGERMSTYSMNRTVGSDVTFAGAMSGSFVDGMGWDKQAKRLVALSGGSVYGIDATDALGTTATITQLTPSGTPPSARTGAGFVISGAVALLFGGQTAAGCFLGDWWYLDNENAWESRSVATACP